MTHKQVWVRANVPVDEGVAPLVAALAEFRGVGTVSSCEGDAAGSEGPIATVTFVYCPDDPREAMWIEKRPLSLLPAEFGAWLGQELLATVHDDAKLSVSYSHNPPLLTLAVRKCAAQGVADVLREIAAREIRYSA